MRGTASGEGSVGCTGQWKEVPATIDEVPLFEGSAASGGFARRGQLCVERGQKYENQSCLAMMVGPGHK
eukprot:2135265-Lingulodinium_polyedra.AAC.1